MLEDAPHDTRIVDQRDDPHRPLAPGTFQRIGLVTSPQRLAVLPEVPTVAESGYPGFQVDNMYGVLAPHGTPPEVVKKLHDDILRVLQQPEVRKALEAATIDIIANTPEEFARYIDTEYTKWAQLLKASGTRVE